jgi:hypothetical protein
VTSVPGSRDEALTDDIIEAAYVAWRDASTWDNERAIAAALAAVLPRLRAHERVRSADDVDAIADRLEYNRMLHSNVINAYRHAADVLRGGVPRGSDHA